MPQAGKSVSFLSVYLFLLVYSVYSNGDFLLTKNPGGPGGPTGPGNPERPGKPFKLRDE